MCCMPHVAGRAIRLAILLGFTPSLLCAQAPAPLNYEKDLRPLLEMYCFRCHGPERPRHDVNLAKFTDLTSIQNESRLWRTVLLQINTRAMPPEDRPQPSAIERDRMITFIHDSLARIDNSTLPKDPGRVTIRRLNRSEYNNTVRTLFDINSAPADTFPADPAGGGGFDNNADVLFIPPILAERYLEAAKIVVAEANDRDILTTRPSDQMVPREAAGKILEHFAPRIFRRPVPAEEREKYLKLFDQASTRGDSFDASVRLMLRAMLVSPHFLYLVEAERESDQPWALNDYELASRLSYFLWSDMPDDELFKIAAEGKLREPEILKAQVKRMLVDPRARAIAYNFGTQWLGIRELLTTAQPDANRFPGYSAPLRDSMFNEAVRFLDSVFRENVSLMTLLDADYVMINDDLSRHYGVGQVLREFKGEEFRKAIIQDSPRGGILGLAAVHVVTSYPLRTSPVLRGKWIMDTVLGAPPPPPPPDAGELPQDDKQADGLTFRQRLEQHRTRPECATCHNRLDPPGFAMENFDAIGQWRTQDNGLSIDSRGILATGETVNGPAELKKALVGQKDAFLRNLTERMLSYALGRGLENYDQRAVEQIVQKLKESENSSLVLFNEIAASYPFQYRRSNPVAARNEASP